MEISENGKRLEKATMFSMSENGVIPDNSKIISVANHLRQLDFYAVNDEEFNQIIINLKKSLDISLGTGSKVVNKNHKPWLKARKPEIDPFYWERYELTLRQQNLPIKVINSLDTVTDDLLDLSGNPNSEEGWPRRGLVMGDVQSGKTSNYTGLICKAADAGYKLIILLTGTLESLRKQTQERLDFGFVGLDSSGIVSRNRQNKSIGVGLIDGRRAAGVFTSTEQDFKASTMGQLGFRIDAFNEPILLVVKKNTSILKNLKEWLINNNANNSGKIYVPMLLIDDEADNASINTSDQKVTAINAGIRSLLMVFPRSTFIGFTATPFANVFIHPDSEEQMLGDDLFPRDFVYALDSPTNYLGANKIFGDSVKEEIVRTINDADQYFPRAHKSTITISDIPISLEKAIYTFLIACTVMDIRGGITKHRSMLINVTHYTNVQNQVKDIVEIFLKGIQNDIRSYSSIAVQDALKNKNIKSLHNIFQEEYGDLELDWTTVLRRLKSSTLPVTVRAVNKDTGPSSLNYAAHTDDGLRVIAIGGNSLARGLTLEGLCTSYFYRTTAMYDALLQMGRWFGYRPNYEDLIRIYLSDESQNWYSHIAEASEELRMEIKNMQLAGLSPIDFGLKVRSHPDALMITAKNKMRHSAKITRLLSISEEGLETARILYDETVLTKNFNLSQKLIGQINHYETDQRNKNPIWSNIPKALISDFLRHFLVHPVNVSFHPTDIADFLEYSSDSKLALWDILIPNGSDKPIQLNSNISINLQRRKVSIDEMGKFLSINENKMKVASGGIEKEGLTNQQIDAAEKHFYSNENNQNTKNVPDKIYRKFRSRPLLILHFLAGYVNGENFKTPNGISLIALGISFPTLENESRKIHYRINLVEIKNLSPEEDSKALADDEDEDLEDLTNII